MKKVILTVCCIERTFDEYVIFRNIFCLEII